MSTVFQRILQGIFADVVLMPVTEALFVCHRFISSLWNICSVLCEVFNVLLHFIWLLISATLTENAYSKYQRLIFHFSSSASYLIHSYSPVLLLPAYRIFSLTGAISVEFYLYCTSRICGQYSLQSVQPLRTAFNGIFLLCRFLVRVLEHFVSTGRYLEIRGVLRALNDICIERTIKTHVHSCKATYKSILTSPVCGGRLIGLLFRQSALWGCIRAICVVRDSQMQRILEPHS